MRTAVCTSFFFLSFPLGYYFVHDFKFNAQANNRCMCKSKIFPLLRERKKRWRSKEGSLRMRRRLGNGRTRKYYQESPRIKRWVFLSNKMYLDARTEGLTIYIDCQGVIFTLGDSKMTSLAECTIAPGAGTGLSEVDTDRRQGSSTKNMRLLNGTEQFLKSSRCPVSRHCSPGVLPPHICSAKESMPTALEVEATPAPTHDGGYPKLSAG